MLENTDYQPGVDQSILMDIQRTQSQLNMTLAQFQLNFKDEIERYEYLLRGVIKDADTGALVQIHEPILNERGRTHVMKKVRTWLTKIVAQSNFDEDMIRSWCRVYWAELVGDAMSFGDNWDLMQDEYTAFVHDLIHSLYSMMSASRDGGLREIIGRISKTVESINTPVIAANKKFGV